MHNETGFTADGLKWTFKGPDAMGNYFYFVNAPDGVCLEHGNGTDQEQQRDSMAYALLQHCKQVQA